jgi:hypothetical protein
VHSDIGGGYAHDQYETVVAYLDAPGWKNAEQVTAELTALTKEFRARFTRVLKNGQWVIDDSTHRTPKQRRILAELTRTEINARTDMKTSEHFLIVDSACLSNKLTLVAMQVMLTYALAEKLPFQADPRRAKVPNVKFYEHPNEPTYQAYREIILKMAAKPGPDKVDIPYRVYFPLSELYVHESANYNRDCFLAR